VGKITNNNQETVKKLTFQFKEFGADAKCSDITRVFRIPGNINPKTGEKAYVVDCFENRVTLSELATAVGICKGKTVSDKKRKSRQRKFEMYYPSLGKSRYTKVNMQRDEDSVREYLNEVNKLLVLPYDSVDTVIRYAKRNFERYEEDYEGTVKYTNRAIVGLLGITEEEQEHMKQLIGREEADKRIEESSKKTL